jgi:hypothetical protein
VLLKNLVPFALVLAACAPTTTTVVSSKAILGAQQSAVLVQQDPQPVALELAKMFTMRGFPLADMQADEGGIWLHLKGNRRNAVEQVSPGLDAVITALEVLGDNPQPGPYVGEVADVSYGSAFWVRIEPRATGTSMVTIVGRVIRNGQELCTEDAKLPGPCVRNEDSLSEAPGAVEAEVVQGVFAHLRLGGSVLTADTRPTYEEVAAGQHLAACRAQRAEQMLLAQRISNAKARANVLGALPTCE